MGEKQNGPFQLSFNASLKVDFQGSRVTPWVLSPPGSSRRAGGKTALGRPLGPARSGPRMFPSERRVMSQKVDFWGQMRASLTSAAVRRRAGEHPPACLLLPGGLEA